LMLKWMLKWMLKMKMNSYVPINGRAGLLIKLQLC
jgi:hypothetical protein